MEASQTETNLSEARARCDWVQHDHRRRPSESRLSGSFEHNETCPNPVPWEHPLDSRWKDNEMRKGFTRKPQADEPATRGKNYITRSGLQRLKDEHRFLLTRERPAVTKVVAWAASNGDRSENADYQYNKRRLRQIDRRIRYLTKRIDAAEVIDPEARRAGRT